mgnify:CR=1 FL=1
MAQLEGVTKFGRCSGRFGLHSERFAGCLLHRVKEEAKKEEETANTVDVVNQDSLEGGVYPMIQIKSNKVMQEDIVSMRLECDAFVPTMNLTISDSAGKLNDLE